MTTLDPLTEPLVRLFLRIDAAHPTNELLRCIADFWQTKRASKLAPEEGEMNELPDELLSNTFIARLTSNGTRHWLACNVGVTACSILHVKDEEPIEAADKRSAVRLRRLFDLVAEKYEPYSVMFDSIDQDGKAQLIEVFAAPLGSSEETTDQIFAAVSSRVVET